MISKLENIAFAVDEKYMLFVTYDYFVFRSCNKPENDEIGS